MGPSNAAMILLQQINQVQTSLAEIQATLDRLEKKSAKHVSRRLTPDWLTPQMLVWIFLALLALGGHITADQLKALLLGLPR